MFASTQPLYGTLFGAILVLLNATQNRKSVSFTNQQNDNDLLNLPTHYHHLTFDCFFSRFPLLFAHSLDEKPVYFVICFLSRFGFLVQRIERAEIVA